MLDEKLIHNTFYIYKCVAKRADETTIERILKIQSYFNVEDLAIALITMSDAPGLITEVKVECEDYEYTFDGYTRKIYEETYSFADLDENKNIIIKIMFEDGIVNKYDCEYIGLDTQEKRISRITPICISASGYIRETHNEYLKERESLNIRNMAIYDNYYESEKTYIEWAVHDLKRLFTSYKYDYYNNY